MKTLFKIIIVHFFQSYDTLPDPFFVMYDDRCKSFIIRAVDDIKWDSGISV